MKNSGINCIRLQNGMIKTERELEKNTKYVFVSDRNNFEGMLFPVYIPSAYISKCIHDGRKIVFYAGRTNGLGKFLSSQTSPTPSMEQKMKLLEEKKKQERKMKETRIANKIKYLRKCKNIDRLSLYFKFREYNLLEHQYMTAMLFKQFASIEDIAYTMVEFEEILCHDVLETITTDLSYEVKNLSAETKRCWNKIEEEVIENNPILSKFSDKSIKECLTKEQYKMFKCCDLLDLWMFCKEEQVIGNSHRDIKRVVATCEKLINGKYKSIDKFMSNYEF